MKLMLVFLCCVLAFFLIRNDPLNIDEETEDHITVTVKGAVEEEKTVQLDRYSILQEALDETEISDTADLDALNPRTVLKDNDCIVIPEKSERKKVSINTGTAEELMTLPGIGPATAEKIIQYREENGLFREPDDLMRVKGIGEKKMSRLRDLITL